MKSFVLTRIYLTEQDTTQSKHCCTCQIQTKKFNTIKVPLFCTIPYTYATLNPLHSRYHRCIVNARLNYDRYFYNWILSDWIHMAGFSNSIRNLSSWTKQKGPKQRKNKKQVGSGNIKKRFPEIKIEKSKKRFKKHKRRR